MARDVSLFVRGCSVCAISKSPRHLPAGKLVPLPIPRRPWSHVGVDFVTNLPQSEGFTCILIAVDRFSKACRLIPLKGLPTALETAEALFHHVFRNYGIPEDIVSDRGPQFISHVWKAFLKLLGISVSLSSGYHPQTNGQTERKIQDIGKYLRAYCHDNQHSWNRFLPWAEYAQNSLRQTTTGLTPFQCILGYQPPLFPWTEEPSDVPAVDHWFRASERVWDSAHIQLQQAVRRHKSFADARRSHAPAYPPGDRVWLSTRHLRLRLPCRKLSPRYIGPFTIERQINEVTFLLQLPARYRIHPVFHVSLLKPFSPSVPGSEEPAAPPPPEVQAEPSIYRVRDILTPADGPATWNISSTGKGTGRRKDPGWSGRMFWIPPFWPSSIKTTQTGLHPEDVAGPVAVVGRQEPPLEEGVMSGNHSHHKRLSPDHNHLITEHHHLSPLIKSTISTHSSQAVTVWSQTLIVLLTWLTYLCLSPSCSRAPISVPHLTLPL